MYWANTGYWGRQLAYHENVGNVQTRHQCSHWLLRWLAMALLQGASLMLKILCQELFKVVQLEGARLA